MVSNADPLFAQQNRNPTEPGRSCLGRTRFPELGVGYILFASNSDWFPVLFTSVVIDQSNCPSFGFTITQSKIALKSQLQ